jgi:hypothetical protein
MNSATSGHHLILGSRVTHTPVFNRAGDKIGHVEDLSIDKVSGQVVYAIVAFGGFLGIGERWHPLPWSMLDYEPERNGYVVGLDKAELEKAPSLTSGELEELGARESMRTELFEYYARYGVPPYV